MVCQNEGTCLDGACDCPVGFEGDLCEIFSRDRILGNFDVSSECIRGEAATQTWGIGASADASNEILINNFHIPALNVIATLTDSVTIEILEQLASTSNEGYIVQGFGSIETENLINIQYIISDFQ